MENLQAQSVCVCLRRVHTGIILLTARVSKISIKESHFNVFFIRPEINQTMKYHVIILTNQLVWQKCWTIDTQYESCASLT